MGFTKLFSDIISSSIWNEDDKTRIVWITLLAIKGPNNIAPASMGGLAHHARVSMDDCKKAIEVLLAPDPDDRSGLFDGRRIERVQGGFLILNGERYRQKRDADDLREYQRNYHREYRKKRKLDVNQSKQSSTSGKQLVNEVNNVNNLSTNVNPSPSSPPPQSPPPRTPPSADNKDPETSLCSLDELKNRIGGWFKRRPTTAWSEKEMKSLRVQRNAPADDLEALERYYTATDIPREVDWRRKDALTLLNNFPGEIDRARTYVAEHKSEEFKPTIVEKVRPATPEEIAASRDLFSGCGLKTISGRADNGTHS